MLGAFDRQRLSKQVLDAAADVGVDLRRSKRRQIEMRARKID